VKSSDAESLQQSGFHADGDGISCCSQIPSGWDSNCSPITQHRPSTVDSTQESNSGQFYIPGDDDDDDGDVHSIGSGDDEGFHLDETVSSRKWSDMSGLFSAFYKDCFFIYTMRVIHKVPVIVSKWRK
jgi:hypothetical protein